MAIALVPGDVGIQLGVPVLRVGGRAVPAHGAVVPVPEATIHKDDLVSGAEDQIRRPWQLASTPTDVLMLLAQYRHLAGRQCAVQPEAVTGGIQHPAQLELRIGVFAWMRDTSMERCAVDMLSMLHSPPGGPRRLQSKTLEFGNEGRWLYGANFSEFSPQPLMLVCCRQVGHGCSQSMNSR